MSIRENIRNKKGWSRTLLLLLSALGVCLVASAIEPGNQYEKVIYRWSGPEEPIIVPASYLTMDPEAVPVTLPEERMEDFNSMLYDLTEGGRTSRCVPSQMAGHYRDIKGKITVLEVAQAQDVFILGTVEGVMIGWDFSYQGPTHLVFIRVDEILKDSSNSLSVGSLVTLDQPYGTLEILGANFCVAKPDFMIELPVGKEVAFAGLVAARNETHILAADGHIFEVEGELIMSDRHQHFETTSVALTDLRGALDDR